MLKRISMENESDSYKLIAAIVLGAAGGLLREFIMKYNHLIMAEQI